jgi:SAM-dependent methyltransferase
LSDVLGPGNHEICDLGCGNGDLLAEFKARGHSVVGVEVDEDARRNAGEKGIETHVGYAEALPDAVKRRTFDLVTMIHVLEHCADPLLALRNAYDLLRPGGYLAVEVPNNEAIFAERLGPAWFNCDAGRHLNFFTAKSLVAALQSLDLEILACRYSGYVSAFQNKRIAAEQATWDLLYKTEDASCADQPRGSQPRVRHPLRNSKLRQWLALLRTAAARPARKYEVLGVLCRHGGDAIPNRR